MSRLRFAALGGAIVLALGVAACGDDSVPLSGSIHIDGSGTVAPLTRAMAKRFIDENPDVRIAVGTSSTDDRVAREQIPVVNDAVILMVNPKTPIRCLTTAQLKRFWQPGSDVTSNWSQLDSLDPPYGANVTAWGPGTDTETFAFFTKAINGKQGVTRDYNNVLHHEENAVDAVARTPGSLGYADHPYYAARARSVKAIAVDSGAGCVAPSPETIADGTFRPLARRLFVHAPAEELARPTMKAFLQFYLDNIETVAPEVGFIPLTDEQLTESKARLERLIAEADGSRSEAPTRA